MSGQPAQTKTIRSQLLADMKDGAYASCERLPRESVLAEKLGISRTQLRDILASLEREGFITRRHGVGTIINRHVLNVQTRMDIEVEFLDMIRQSGHEPAVAFVRVSDGTADAQVAAQLRIPEDTPIIRTPGCAPRMAGLPSTARTWWKRPWPRGITPSRTSSSPSSTSSSGSAASIPIWI